MLVISRYQDESIILNYAELEKRILVYEVHPSKFVRLLIDDVVHLLDQNDSIQLTIGDKKVLLMVTSFKGDSVKLGITADRIVQIHRSDKLDKIKNAD